MAIRHKNISGGGAVKTVSCPFCGMPKSEMNGNNLPAHLRRECKEMH
jgi:hypothetical protein